MISNDIVKAVQRALQLQSARLNSHRAREVAGQVESMNGTADGGNWWHFIGAMAQARVVSGIEGLGAPDKAKLPLICVVGSEVLVIKAEAADGQWIAEAGDRSERRLPGEQCGRCVRVRPPEPMPSGAGLATAKFKQTFLLQKGLLTQASFATLVVSMLALATSIFSMQVYDRVIPFSGHHTLIVLAVGVVAAIFLEMIVKLARSTLLDEALVRTDQTLSRDVFERLMSIRVDKLPRSVGTLAAQVRGFEQVRGFSSVATMFVLVDAPLALIFLTGIFVIGGASLSLIPTVFLLISLVVGLAMKRKVEGHVKAGSSVTHQKSGLLFDVVQSAESIKALNAGWKFMSRWLDLVVRSSEHDRQVRHASEMTSYNSQLLTQLCYVMLITVGAWLATNGELSQGALIACSILSGRVLAPIGSLPNLLTQAAHAKAALAELDRLYALTTDQAADVIPLAPECIKGEFLLQNPSFQYDKEGAEIKLPELRVSAGEKVGIIGPIGAGKSTILRMLAGLYTPTAGKVLIDGLDISHISRATLSDHVGYLGQDTHLFAGTLRDNLLAGLPDPGDDAILLAARQTGLISLISGHPKGLAMRVFEGGSGVSGGQRQQIGVTRLLLSGPTVWMLDEPTASMDEQAEVRALQALRAAMKPEHTVFIVTHKPALLALVERLWVAVPGGLQMDGPRDAVLAQLKANAQANAPRRVA